jgi:hypothetical protein
MDKSGREILMPHTENKQGTLTDRTNAGKGDRSAVLVSGILKVSASRHFYQKSQQNRGNIWRIIRRVYRFWPAIRHLTRHTYNKRSVL